MAVVYHEIYLPIDTESTFDYIVIKQGDAGTHKVRATLISNNRVYTIPTSGASYFMKFRKPDNNYCLVEATVSDNTISAEVTEEMLRVSGTGRGEFMIVSGSNELKTATFHVKIVKETFTSGDVQSHSDFAPFAALLQGAGAAASNANTAAAAANAAANLAEQKAQAIPDDYSELVADVAGKADKSTTYTKNEVDQMIEDVEVETDTTLAVSGAPADAAETGRQFGLIKADLGALTTPERLVTNTDLNDITTPGVYALHSSLAYDNIPEGDFFHNGFLEVYEEVDGSGNMTRIFQRITFYPVEDAVVIWARYYSAWHDFGWSEWFRVESNEYAIGAGIIEILEGNSMTIEIKNVDDRYTPEIAYVEILPHFASSGTPDMDNIIDFTGHTSGEVINAVTRATASTEVTETYNFPYDWSETEGTVYHGIIDLKTGRFTADGYLVTIDGASDVRASGSGDNKRFTFKLSEQILIPNDVPIACNMFPCVKRDVLNYGHAGISMASDGQTIWFKPEYGTEYYDYTASQMKTFLSSHPLKVVFRLANPAIYNLSSSNISIRYGVNSITVDCGKLHMARKAPTYSETLELISKDSKWIVGNDVYITNLKNEYPTYSDDDLLDLAITRAAARGKNTRIIWDGTDIHFSGKVTHTCAGFGGIDFNGSKIYMPDYDNGIILEIVPDSSEDVTASAADFTSYKTVNQDLFGKVFTLNNNTASSGNAGMCLGERSGNYNVYWSPTVITNKDGLFATGDLYLTPSTGDVICWNVHEIPKITFVICNGTIISNTDENMSNFLHCKRSNVKLSNFTLDGRSSITIFHNGVFTFRQCCEIEIDHIYGTNPATLPTSGYAIGLYSVTNAYVHDCSIGDGLAWGALGANHLMNTVFERCNLSRWDCHYAQTGHNVIRECKLNQISYGIGNGVIVVENCELRPDEISNNEINLIGHRADMAGVFDGDIIVRGCVFRKGGQAKNKLNILMDGCSFAVSNSSAVDWVSKKKRIIENCQFLDGCNKIFIAGSAIAAEADIYSEMTYIVKNCVIDCADSVIDSLGSVQEEVGGIVIEDCEFENQCYITKALTGTAINIKGCKFENVSAKVVQNTKSIIVSNSELSNIVSDSASAKLIATGNNFSGVQSVSNFTDYALAGNIASDMTSVNKHS